MEYTAKILIVGASNEHHDAVAQPDRLARQIVAAGNEHHALAINRLGCDARRDRQVRLDSGRRLRWGRTVHKLAGMATSGRVKGIDSCEASVMVSRRTNKQFIGAGQVEIRHGSVSSLPFSDSEFDLVIAVNSHYHWPDLAGGMKELLRTLKPGGTLMILGGAYKGRTHSTRNRRFAHLIGVALQSRDELGSLFAAAGYAEVRLFEDDRRGWICGVGRRPSQFSQGVRI